MKRLIKLAAICLLCSTAFATVIPKKFGENVRFIASGDAVEGGSSGGKLQQHRFLLAMFYLVDSLGLNDKKLPKIVVIHANSWTSDFLGLKEDSDNLGVMLAHNDEPFSFYEVWLRGDATDTKFVLAISKIFQFEYALDVDTLVKAAVKARVRLQSEVSVEDFKAK